MTQNQKIGEIEVGLDQLEQAFLLLGETVSRWRNGVQILREAGMDTIAISGGIDGLMRPPIGPVPPPQDSGACLMASLIDEYISDVRVAVGAYFGALESLNDGPAVPDGPLS